MSPAMVGSTSNPEYGPTDHLRRGPPTLTRPGKLILEVLGGPQRGERFAVDQAINASATAGRGHGHPITLRSTSVSANHFRITLTTRGVVLEDLGSTNGTRIGDHLIDRVILTEPTVFSAGDVPLRIASITAVEVAASPETAFGGLMGVSDSMRELFAQLARVASIELPVLINGETGTGKEEAAQAIHAHSGRRGRFVAINCGAVPHDLAESLLFGHVKGAFTGAEDRPGAFEAAHGGTLFLDEVGELPASLQPKLLRVLDRPAVQRVGEFEPRPIDVRIVAATHRDLRERIAEGTFREDLYYRLTAQAPICIPPLRDREDDIPFLARIFAANHPRALPLSPQAEALLGRLTWHGNVRQLKNAILAAAALAEGDRIEADDLRRHANLGELRHGHAEPLEPLEDGREPERYVSTAIDTAEPHAAMLERMSREYFATLLEQLGGDLDAVAEASGYGNRHSLKKKLKKLGLVREPSS